MKKTIFLLSFFVGYLLLSQTAPHAAGLNHPSQADTAKQCSICHYRWVYTFYVEHRDTPLAPLEEEKVVGTRDMCLSCHDGSVHDSRDRICNDPGHSVGNIPSDRVKIPEHFPLDHNGAMQCSTCHTPHAIETSKDALVEFFLRVPNKDSSFCKECHRGNTGGVARGNHPTEVSAAERYPSIVAAGGLFGSGMPNEIICETCHSPHGGVNNRRLVLSVEDPKTHSVLCEVCHTTKPGMTGDPALNRFSHPLDLTPDFLVHIPPRWESGEAVVLGRGGELVCRTCHLPHGAVDTRALLAERNNKDSLCLECHRDQGNVKESAHYQKVIAEDERNIVGKAASESGPCSPCHLVHQGSGPLMWARTTPMSPEKPGEVCLSCHNPEGPAAQVMPAVFSHPLEVTVPQTDTDLSLPLFDAAGVNRRGTIRCSTCHDFHSPSPRYRYSLTREEGNHATFLRLSEKGASALCLDCHPRYESVKGTDHDLRITAPDYVNANGQPLAWGDICSSCHMAHAKTPQRYLWSAPLGPSVLEGWEETYTTKNDIMIRMCTGCHAPGGVAEAVVPRFGLHPRNTLAEGMPGINFALVKNIFPIFTDGGEVAESGHIVCSTCHNPHQWDPRVAGEGPAREVEGNVSNSFLRAGLHTQFCTGCHGEDILVKFTYYHGPAGRTGRKK